MNITAILPIVLITGATLMEHYVCFKDNERYEDKEGTAYNLHVTHRKYLQNSGQNFSREGLFKKLRYGSEDKIKIDLKREI